MSGDEDILFSPEVMAAAKRRAEAAGITAPSWIRGVVEREIERRSAELQDEPQP